MKKYSEYDGKQIPNLVDLTKVNADSNFQCKTPLDSSCECSYINCDNCLLNSRNVDSLRKYLTS